MGICAIYSRPFRQNNNFDDIWWCGWTDSPHSAFQNGPDLSIIKESRKGIFWPDVLLCVLAVAVWGDYVLSRNPTVTRSIHNSRYIICSVLWLILSHAQRNPPKITLFFNLKPKHFHLHLVRPWLKLPKTGFWLFGMFFHFRKVCLCVKVLVMAALHWEPRIHIRRMKGRGGFNQDLVPIPSHLECSSKFGHNKHIHSIHSRLVSFIKVCLGITVKQR